jgi:hypothetical protein
MAKFSRPLVAGAYEPWSWVSSVVSAFPGSARGLSSRGARIGAEAVIWLLNIACAFFATYYLFRMNSKGVFWGYDSQSFWALAGLRFQLSNVLLGLGSDFVYGLGNVIAPPNPRWFPSFLLAWSKAGGINGPLSYAIGATELFIATALGGRALRFALPVCVAAGWFITLWTWPLYVWPKIVTLWFFTPTHAEILSVSVFLVVASLFAGLTSIRRSALLFLLVFLGITHIVLGHPTHVILIVPTIAIAAAVSFFHAEDRVKRFTVLTGWGVILALCVLAGHVQFLHGLFSYTTSAVFPEINQRPQTFFGGETTLLLWTPVTHYSNLLTPERIFVGGGIVACCGLWLFGGPAQRRLAQCVLISETLFLALGFSNYTLGFQSGPQIWYFELMLFPYFALAMCFAAVLLAASPLRVAILAFPGMRCDRVGRVGGAALALAVPLAIAAHASIVGPAVREEARSFSPYALATPIPQSETSITRVLKSETRIVAGEPFRGRVANFLGHFPQARESHISAGILPFFSLMATGNLHDGPGLWQDNIPTFVEFHRLLSPTRFVFSRYFSFDQTSTSGGWKVELRLLRTLGVRFIITDLPMEGLLLRAQVEVTTPPSAYAALGLKPAFESFQLYLYELGNVNLGQYSPTKFQRATDASSMLTFLADSSVDPAHNVVTVEPPEGSLTKAHFELFQVNRDGYRVRARSQGEAALLLPVEFSRCLQIASRIQAAPPRLVRADLLLTMVIFERELDADITFRTGPFGASSCRSEDAADVHAMRLRNVFDTRPDLLRSVHAAW